MTKSRFTNRAPLLLAIVALSVFGLSCSRLTEFTITLRPPRVLRILQTAIDMAEVGAPIDISAIEITDQYIRVGGSYTADDGTNTSGIVDLALSTQAGQLRAEIANVDITGLDLTAEQLAAYNEILSREFNRAATSIPGISIVSVDTVRGAVKVGVRLGLGQ